MSPGPEIAQVDFQKGLVDAPPPWVNVIFVAKWLGVNPWDLAEREDGDEWTELALLLMNMERHAQERQQAKAARARKGGKR